MSNNNDYPPIENVKNDLSWTSDGKVTKLLNAGHSIEEILTNKSLLQKENQSIKYNYIIEKMSDKPQWQPIETAPKDGTQILSYHNREILYSNGERKKFEWIQIVRWAEVMQWDNPEDEYDWLTGSNFDEPTDPTHWMPLPKPPIQ
jgi:hypothetical protein